MLYYILFFLIFSTVFFLVHYFIYRRINTFFSFSVKTNRYIGISFLVFALLVLFSRFLFRGYSPALILTFVGLWLGIVTIVFTVFVVEYFLEFIIVKYKRYLRYFSLASILIIAVLAYYNACGVPEIKKVELSLPVNFINLKGFKIVQLSDLHIDKSKSEKWLEQIVIKVNSLEPDLVLFTGDLIDENICLAGKYCEILKLIKAKFGIFAVFGNHEYYTGEDIFYSVAKQIGIKVLVNEAVVVDNRMTLVGLDEETGARMGKSGPDISAALKGKTDKSKLIVVMTHQPKAFELAEKYGVYLQLSGHTHGGQMPPFTFLVPLIFKYDRGLNKLRDSYIYTSQGAGFWGPPMRLFSTSEITEFILQ